jgi:hypothetical protein
MSIYDNGHFLARYRAMETEELMRLVITRDLVPEALDAVRMVLAERGVAGDSLEREHVDALKSFTRMAGVTNHCDFCGAPTVLYAVGDEGQRFCGPRCRNEARLLEASFELAPDLIATRAEALFTGPCPRCAQRGKPIEMRPRWRIAAAFVFTSTEFERELLCRRCGERENWKAAFFSLLFGWWSVSGVYTTPVVI